MTVSGSLCIRARSKLGKSSQGVTYLGYKVYPHYLHVCQRKCALKSRLDFSSIWPQEYPRCQKPMRGVWDKLLHEEELEPPVMP